VNAKILCVDDDAGTLVVLERLLRNRFRLDMASCGAEALQQIGRAGPYAVVLADMHMPGMNGIEFLKLVEARAPDSVRIMVTGSADQKTAVDAVNQGHVFRFLNKPFEPEPLVEALQAAVRQHELIIAERELLEDTLSGAIKILTEILGSLDPRAFGQGERLREGMRAFTQVYPVQRAWEFEMAAMLAFIGRVTVPTTVLLKERSGLSLNGPEKLLLSRVPELGAALLEHIPRLDNVARIVRYQSKNFDGTGVPYDHVAGEQIPIGSRVLHVLIDLARLEAAGLSKALACDRMEQTDGTYDPAVVNAACQCFDVAVPAPAKPGRTVKIPEVEVDQILAEDLYTRDGILVLATGNRITPMLLECIRNCAALNSIPDAIQICG